MKKSRTRYHHGDLRTALVDETERMVEADELDKVTLNELGKRIGVARSAPYRHFGNKNELLCEVAVRAFSHMLVSDRRIRENADLDTAEKLRAMAHAYFDIAVNHRDRYRLMYREGLIGESESPALLAVREEVFAELVMILAEGQKRGRIAEGDLEAQALFCWAPFHGMASFVIDEHIPAELFREMLDWTVDSVLRGLGKG
jgi:AcrR family transcriptional regulator